MINKTASTLTKLAVPTVALAVFSSLPAQAGTVYNATFLSIADNRFDPYVDNVSFGDPFKVVIALDNGGSSILNQTWTASDVISVTFDFNNGAHKTVFDPNGGNGFSQSIGSFVTNGLGQLTAVPLSWTDESQVNVISTNSTQTPNAWYLNAFNNKYYTNDFDFAVGIPVPRANTVAANWTIAPAPVAAVPEPSALFGLFAFGSIGLLSLKRKG